MRSAPLSTAKWCDSDGFVSGANRSARSPAVISPRCNKRRISRRVGSAGAGQAGDVGLGVCHREAEHLDEALAAPLEMAPQAEETLTVVAEGIEADGNRPAIRPEELIPFIGDAVLAPVPGGVAAE